MRKFTKLAIALIGVPLTLMLAGCGITHGNIIEKQYTPAYTSFTMTCSGKPTHCITIPLFHTDHWAFEIQGPDDKGKTDTSWVNVDKAVYDAHQKGEFFDSENQNKKS